jgi:hypothetical protein
MDGVFVMRCLPPKAPRTIFILGLLSALIAVPLAAQELSYTVSTAQAWTDTGMDLTGGSVLAITASAAASTGCNPAGVQDRAAKNLPMPAGLPGALLARLQVNGPALLVGTGLELHVDEPGHLWFGVNASGPAPCQGSFSVKVKVTQAAAVPEAAATPATAATPAANVAASASGAKTAPAANSAQGANSAAAPAGKSDEVKDVKGALYTAAQTWLSGQLGTGAATSQPAATTSTSATPGSGATPANAAASPSLKPTRVSTAPLDGKLRKDIDDLPRRVNDQFDHQGDMVNFIIVGSQTKVADALTAADWHIADRDVKESVLKAALETYQKKAYMTMPMSDLYLFGRVQDFGYEQAEPYAVVASRHHFRIWKAPFQYNGQDVWVGAGTHDIGFEKDQRNGNVTHKIDPAVDGERDNIGATLEKADQVKQLTYYLPPNPVQEAKNATGGGYHSDGRILVIELK